MAQKSRAFYTAYQDFLRGCLSVYFFDNTDIAFLPTDNYRCIFRQMFIVIHGSCNPLNAIHD
jgi:hypothetical protein